MRNCEPCDKLKKQAIEMTTIGLTPKECESLKEDLGYNSTAEEQHDDETDLALANDCLISNLENEIECYDGRTWKEFITYLISNISTMFRSIICAIGGLWTNIHKLWTDLKNAENDIDALKLQLDGQTFRTYSYVVPADKFIKVADTTGGTGMSYWFSGSPEKAECYIEIPIGTMKSVTSVFAEPTVVGEQVKPVTTAIQTFEKIGDKLRVNFDTYEITGGSEQPFSVRIQFLVLGIK